MRIRFERGRARRCGRVMSYVDAVTLLEGYELCGFAMVVYRLCFFVLAVLVLILYLID